MQKAVELLNNLKDISCLSYCLQSTLNSSISHCSYLEIYILHKIWLLKANFNSTCRPNPSLFWAGNSDLLYSYLLQNFSNPLLFTHCCCYSKELTYLNCHFCIKSQFKHVNPYQQCVKKAVDLKILQKIDEKRV